MTLAVTPGSGATMLTDDIAGVKSAVAKIQIGAAGVDGGLISTTNGLPSNIAQVGGSALAFGSAVSASSIPMVIASDQANIPTISGTATMYVGSGITRPSGTTAYALGQMILNNATAGSVTLQSMRVSSAANKVFTVVGGGMMISGTVTTNALFRVHLFNALPTMTNGDTGAFQGGMTMASGGVPIYLGSYDVNLMQGGSDVAVGYGFTTNGNPITATPVSGQNYVYYIIEARQAFTPITNEVFTPIIMVQ